MSLILCDRACQAFEIVVGPYVAPQTQIYLGKSEADKTVLPALIIDADGEGEEDPPRTGNFWIGVMLESRWTAQPNEDGTGNLPDPFIANQSALSILSMGIFLDVASLAAALSAAVQGFTVIPNGIFFEAPTRGQDENGVWIDSVRVKLYCCASTLAP